jgi:hypothetical protein
MQQWQVRHGALRHAARADQDVRERAGREQGAELCECDAAAGSTACECVGGLGVSVIHKTPQLSQVLTSIFPMSVFKWSWLLCLVLTSTARNASAQPNEPQLNVELQSMSAEELKRFNAEIVRTHPFGNCLAWLAFDEKNVTTPVAIYDLWKDGAIMKINNRFVHSARAITVDATEISRNQGGIAYAFFQEFSYVTNFYEKSKRPSSKNKYEFSLRTENLKISTKEKKCTFANAQCRKYAGDFSLSVSSLNEGAYKLLTVVPVGRLMIEDMCPVARGNGARNSPLRELSGLVEQSNLGRSSEKHYLNDLAANGIRQSWLKPYITLQEALK